MPNIPIPAANPDLVIGNKMKKVFNEARTEDSFYSVRKHLLGPVAGKAPGCHRREQKHGEKQGEITISLNLEG